MPRLPRGCFETTFFHVITQGINKSYVFDSQEDIRKYIFEMYELKDEYDIQIIAYCIMNNHAHLLLNVEKIDNLSLFMHRLNTKYANYYNKKYKRVGFVFRNRFKSEAIFNESYLYSCINYIFNNPVKAGICKTPEEYKYSNYKDYMCMNNKNKSTDAIYFHLDISENSRERCQEIVNLFLKYKNKSLKQIIINTDVLKELVDILVQNKISFLAMEKVIKINRKKLKKLHEMNYDEE